MCVLFNNSQMEAQNTIFLLKKSQLTLEIFLNGCILYGIKRKIETFLSGRSGNEVSKHFKECLLMRKAKAAAKATITGLASLPEASKAEYAGQIDKATSKEAIAARDIDLGVSSINAIA